MFIASGRKKCEHAKLTDVNMCAFGGGCEGDSGGGLVIQNAEGWDIVKLKLHDIVKYITGSMS